MLFSGSAFVLAMLGLLLVQSTIMRSLAVGAILVGIVSVVAALTLLPAILSLLGDRIERLRVPFARPQACRSAGAGEPLLERRRRPRRAAAGAVARGRGALLSSSRSPCSG